MHAEFNFADDEWFWKAWSETISNRYAKSLHGLYAKHANATLVNERSLLSAEFLEQYAALAMLLERFPAAPASLGRELARWRARGYEDYFRASGLREGQFAINAFAGADARTRRAFAAAVERLDAEAAGAVEAVAALARRGRADQLPALCEERGARLRSAIAGAERVIAGEAEPLLAPPRHALARR